MAMCIHGTHWDGASVFWCPQCAQVAAGVPGFTFTVITPLSHDAALIERVAEAIHANEVCDPAHPEDYRAMTGTEGPEPWAGLAEHERDDFRRQATAALRVVETAHLKAPA